MNSWTIKLLTTKLRVFVWPFLVSGCCGEKPLLPSSGCHCCTWAEENKCKWDANLCANCLLHSHTPAGHYCTHRCSSDEKIFEEGNCWKIAEKTETWALIYPLTSLSHGVRIPGCLCGEGRWDNTGDAVHYYSLSEVKEGNECPIHYTLNWSDEVLQSGPISCYCYTTASLHVCQTSNIIHAPGQSGHT